MTEKTYPPLPKHAAHIHSDGDFCWDTQPQPNLVFWPVDLYTADQMHAYYDLGRDMQTQAAPAASINLTPVIQWLENGRDPKEAAKELRILSTRASSLQAQVVPQSAVPHEDSLDAARYRWLRDAESDVSLVLDKRTEWVPPDETVSGVGGYWQYEYRAGAELDAAIDAARAQTKEPTHDN